MGYLASQGDIVWLNFDPSSGTEITKRRPAYIISRKAFNAHVGLAIVAPITSTVRGIKLEVVLTNTMKTSGSILVHQLKSLDISHRNAEFIEKAPTDIIEKVRNLVHIITN